MTRSPRSSGSGGSRRVRTGSRGSGAVPRGPAILPPMPLRARAGALHGAEIVSSCSAASGRCRWPRGTSRRSTGRRRHSSCSSTSASSWRSPRRPRERDRCRHGHAPHGHRGRRARGVRRAPEGPGRRGHNLTSGPAAKVRRARPRRIGRCLRVPRGRIVAPPRRARRARPAPASREPARVGPEAQAGRVRRGADPEVGRGDPRTDRGAERTGEARGPGVRAREAGRRAPADRAAGE